MNADDSPIDIRALPPPDVIEALDASAIKTSLVTRFKTLMEGEGISYSLVDSDPAIKILEVAAYASFILRARINDAARRTLPAYGAGTTADHIASRYNVYRDDGQPDDVLISLALDVADLVGSGGSKAGYLAQVMACGRQIASPSPFVSANAVSLFAASGGARGRAGEVTVYVLFRSDLTDSAAKEAHLKTLRDHLTQVSPIDDAIVTLEATRREVSIAPVLRVGYGADAKLVSAAAEANIRALFAERSRNVGLSTPASLVYAAIHRQNAVLGVEALGIKAAASGAGKADESGISSDDSETWVLKELNLTVKNPGEK